MKIYLRILQYAPHVRLRFIQFLIYSILAALFSAAYFGLLKPMVEILFNQTKDNSVPPLPEFSLSFNYIKTLFEHRFIKIIVEQGPVSALLFVCICIVILVFLANLFRYMERMVASRTKVDIVKNIRVHIFANVSRLHIGFFNDQRKGALISRFTNDVSEVEGTVVNS
jgi:subfamily B ATP-binding cassette protein MsbA